MWYQNIGSMFFRLITKYACDGQTDGQTDKQNYDPHDGASRLLRAVKTLSPGYLPNGYLRGICLFLIGYLLFLQFSYFQVYRASHFILLSFCVRSKTVLSLTLSANHKAKTSLSSSLRSGY